MWKTIRIRGGVILALAVACWASIAPPAHGYGYVGPPVVQTPPGTVHNCRGCRCNNTCPCTGPNCGIPPGGGSHLPEPATLVSGLIGASLAGMYGWRRKKAVVVE